MEAETNYFEREDIGKALAITETGAWRLEAKPGEHVRFYGDKVLHELIGVDESASPEDCYDLFMTRIYAEDMPRFMEYYVNMRQRQSEIVYRYVHPERGLIYVRCFGKRAEQVGETAFYRGFHQSINETEIIEQNSARRIAEQSELHRKLAYSMMENFADSTLYIDLETNDFKWLTSNGNRYDNHTTYEEMCDEIAADIPKEYRDDFVKNVSTDNLKRIFATESNFSFSTYTTAGESGLRRITLWYCAVDDAHQKLLVVSKDTTEDFRKERELADALVQAKQANRAKTIFLNNMSHDIRTPMNAIVGFSNLARKYVNETDKCLEYLDKITKSSEHLLSLINDILDMSRIENGKIQVNESACSISDIADNLNVILQTDAANRQLDFDVYTENIKNDAIFCDRLRLNQIILNCASNSLKFTHAGGRVEIIIRQKNNAPAGYGCYQFIIHDTGIGMSAEFLEHIFEPFSRDESSHKEQIQGTGLGMAICKNLVDMMSGSMEIESELGVGTTFTITFGFKLADESVVTENEESEDVEIDFSTKKILLVEDNMLNREIALEILGETGMFIESAENGEEALYMVKNSPEFYYDAILMDIQMPVMNGYEATKAIRKLGRADAKKLVIIAMTANAFDEDRQKAIQAGMNEHVSKPIDIPVLMKTLRKFLK